MYETIRIVGKLRPKYVMWENVKNLLSKSHKHNFDAYIETMNVLGYNSYYQVLNAKDYGIPQNRERVYTVSIRKDIDNENFVFPNKEDLVLRLKDMLEDKVDEKYYLSDDKVSKIEKSNFMQEKKRIQDKEYSDTILARDYKDPKCVRVGGMYGQTTRWGLYDDKGLSPTLVAAMGEGGGYIPMVERIGGIFDTENSKHQAGSIYDKEGLAPTLDAMQGGWRQPSIVEDKLPGAYGRNFGSKGKLQDTEGTCDTLQAAMGNGGGNVPIIKEFNSGEFRDLNEYIEYLQSLQKEIEETVEHDFELEDGTVIRVRKLTPKECWRLMGFDDEDFDRAEKVNSNTQLYKQARKFNLCTSFRENFKTTILILLTNKIQLYTIYMEVY